MSPEERAENLARIRTDLAREFYVSGAARADIAFLLAALDVCEAERDEARRDKLEVADRVAFAWRARVDELERLRAKDAAWMDSIPEETRRLADALDASETDREGDRQCLQVAMNRVAWLRTELDRSVLFIRSLGYKWATEESNE